MDEHEELITFGSEIKALGGGKVGGYLIRFSTPEDPDLTGDFFTKGTQIEYGDNMPVYYHHGMDKIIKRRVLGRANITPDDVGLWTEAQLNLRDEYEKEIYKLVESGKLGYSSGALSHLVDREPAGKAMFIKSWTVGEVSLTPTPAEPRNSVVSLKSLVTPDEAALPIDGDDVPTQPIQTGETKMEDIDVKALIDAALKEREETEAKKAAELKALEDARAEGAKKAIEELEKSGSLRKSHYHSTDKQSDSDEGVGAFKAYIQRGDTSSELIRPDSVFQNIKAAFNVTDGATGGYLVPDPLYSRIVAKRDIASWVRQAPCMRLQTQADHILVPVEDTAATDFVVKSEGTAYDENEPTLAQKDISLLKYTKMVKWSEEFASYQATNWEDYIVQVLARAEAGTENTVATANILDGSGATAASASASSTTLTVAELAALVGSLGGGYNVNGEVGFLMKNATKWYLKGLTGNNFNFLPTPQGGDFFGFPAYVSDDMPAMTSGLYSTVFGNFQFFAVCERPGMIVERNPYLYMNTGQVALYARIFRGYDVLQSEAIYKMAQGTA